VINVPFSDRSEAKPRPALVVSTENFHRTLPDVIVCPISSQRRYYQHPDKGDCPLRAWKAAGLRYPSTARVSKLVALDKQIVRRTLGQVASHDLARVEVELQHALGLTY
jgi:mRNA interferase MazF